MNKLKGSFPAKAAAVLLFCLLCLGFAFSAAAVGMLYSAGFYSRGAETAREMLTENLCQNEAWLIADRLLPINDDGEPNAYLATDDNYRYEIFDSSGTLRFSTYNGEETLSTVTVPGSNWYPYSAFPEGELWGEESAASDSGSADAALTEPLPTPLPAGVTPVPMPTEPADEDAELSNIEDTPTDIQPAKPLPQPTFDSVAYGDHPMQKMDVWLPEKGAPTPAIIFVHGGGFRNGSRKDPRLGERIPKCRAARVALISVEYRLLKDAGDVKPPVRVCMDDVTAAIRFVRSKAKEWNIDLSRIGLTGSSAGAHAVLYASLTGDNEFGIRAVYTQYPQTSIDPKEMREWIPNSKYGAPLFGYPDFQTWLDHRDEVL